jgi:crescentin
MILPNGFSWSSSRKPKSASAPSEPTLTLTPHEPPAPDPQPREQTPPPAEPKAAIEIKAGMESKVSTGQERARFAFDQLGEQGEQMAQQVHSIMGRFEDVLTLRDEFGAFIHTFDELMGAHRQARTRLAEQSALLSQHLNTSTSLRREVTDLEAKTAASDAERLGLRHELSVMQQQAHANSETINALKLEAAEATSRATSLERQLVFATDKCTALQDANGAKEIEISNLDKQLADNQRQTIELKNASSGATAEIARLQGLIDEIQPELQRAKQRQTELETALHKAELATKAAEEKVAQEIKEREAVRDKYDREKYEFETTLASLNLQMDGLNSRHTITLKHLDHARSSYAESFEASKQWERSCKQAQAALAASERRLQLSEEQLHALEMQRNEFEQSLSDMAARNEMLSKAIAAKDAQISHLQSKASSLESRYSSLLQSHENEHLQHEAAKRRLLEMLESEKAERALAQGALTIARASREKMSVQIESLKRGRPANILFDLPEVGAENGTNMRVIASSEAPDFVKE